MGRLCSVAPPKSKIFFLTQIVEKYEIIPDIDLFLTWEHTLCLKLHYKVTTVGPESTTKEIDFCIFWIDYHRLPT